MSPAAIWALLGLGALLLLARRPASGPEPSAGPLVAMLGPFARVNFPSGGSQLSEAAYETLRHVAAAVVSSDRVVRLVGHTDNRGDPGRNVDLGHERAYTAALALHDDFGVPTELLAWESEGAESPIADNATEAGRRANRRVDVWWT